MKVAYFLNSQIQMINRNLNLFVILISIFLFDIHYRLKTRFMNSSHIKKPQAIHIIILFKDFSLIINFYEKEVIYF